jgi:hypothetical protein
MFMDSDAIKLHRGLQHAYSADMYKPGGSGLSNERGLP